MKRVMLNLVILILPILNIHVLAQSPTSVDPRKMQRDFYVEYPHELSHPGFKNESGDKYFYVLTLSCSFDSLAKNVEFAPQVLDQYNLKHENTGRYYFHFRNRRMGIRVLKKTSINYANWAIAQMPLITKIGRNIKDLIAGTNKYSLSLELLLR